MESKEVKIESPWKRFKSIRLRLGLTLRQIENATGLSNAYLSQLENGKINKPSYETIEILTKFYESRKQTKRCPCCFSEDIKEEKLTGSNGVFGPGHASWIILNFHNCQSCGVMFKLLDKPETKP
jgi:DNA-binding Xre family transcriptional regulator